MRVKELKKILDQFDENAEVIVPSSNFELKGSLIAVTGVREEKMCKKKETFLDEFDCSIYSKEVYNYSGETDKVVIIS